MVDINNIECCRCCCHSLQVVTLIISQPITHRCLDTVTLSSHTCHSFLPITVRTKKPTQSHTHTVVTRSLNTSQASALASWLLIIFQPACSSTRFSSLLASSWLSPCSAHGRWSVHSLSASLSAHLFAAPSHHLDSALCCAFHFDWVLHCLSSCHVTEDLATMATVRPSLPTTSPAELYQACVSLSEAQRPPTIILPRIIK